MKNLAIPMISKLKFAFFLQIDKKLTTFNNISIPR